MKAIPTSLPGVLLLEPAVHADHRGAFFESYHEERFAALVGSGTPLVFRQDNHSISHRHVLRGLHYQVEHPQGKLVRVVRGSIFDVAVDVRRSSPHFGRWTAVTLSAENRLQLWVPPGFAHGFLATSDEAEVLYKNTALWSPSHERCILWNDPALAIDWPCTAPIVSERDGRGLPLAEAEVFA